MWVQRTHLHSGSSEESQKLALADEIPRMKRRGVVMGSPRHCSMSRRRCELGEDPSRKTVLLLPFQPPRMRQQSRQEELRLSRAAGGPFETASSPSAPAATPP